MNKILFLSAMLTFTFFACANKTSENKNKMESNLISANGFQNENETITLAGGCFWCIEAVFRDLKGVSRVTSGYAGGNVKNPTYKDVCSGLTGHAEVVQISFDPKVIKLEDLLEVFWTIHDPTSLNRQGADVGTQYRSAIFYSNPAQKAIAEKSMIEVATQLWDDPIVTQVAPLKEFYPAEDYHQNYYELNKSQPYCQVVISPKIKKIKEKFGSKLK
jgi:peptide-methionine (S)-S-oxide reductase